MTVKKFRNLQHLRTILKHDDANVNLSGIVENAPRSFKLFHGAVLLQTLDGGYDEAQTSYGTGIYEPATTISFWYFEARQDAIDVAEFVFAPRVEAATTESPERMVALSKLSGSFFEYALKNLLCPPLLSTARQLIDENAMDVATAIKTAEAMLI